MSMLQSGGPQTAPAAPDGLIKETTTQGFMKDVIEESKRQPVLIDFWAPWCGPCKQLTPVLEKVVKAAKGKVKLVKMNIDDHPAIPGQMGIQSIPAVIAFVNGQPADGFMGALPEGQVNAFIERLTKGKIGGEAQDLMKVAEQALAETGLDWAALRPVLVYGPGLKGNMAELMRLARMPYPLPLGGLRARRSLVSVESLASAVATVLDAEGLHRQGVDRELVAVRGAGGRLRPVVADVA